MQFDGGRARVESDATRTAKVTRQDGREARCRVRLRGLWGYSSGGPRPVQWYEIAAMTMAGSRSTGTIELASTGMKLAGAHCASGAPPREWAWHSGQVDDGSPRWRLPCSSLSAGAVAPAGATSAATTAKPDAARAGTWMCAWATKPCSVDVSSNASASTVRWRAKEAAWKKRMAPCIRRSLGRSLPDDASRRAQGQCTDPGDRVACDEWCSPDGEATRAFVRRRSRMHRYPRARGADRT